MWLNNRRKVNVIVGLSALVALSVIVFVYTINQNSSRYQRILKQYLINSAPTDQENIDKILWHDTELYKTNNSSKSDTGIATQEIISKEPFDSTLVSKHSPKSSSDVKANKNSAPIQEASDSNTRNISLPKSTIDASLSAPKSDASLPNEPLSASKNNESLTTPTSNISSSSTAGNISVNSGKKYLIYLCDKHHYCFGLGDRQRGLMSVFLLANVTKRQFGIKMSHPSPLQDFYIPNEVQWDIPETELSGKSTKTIRYFRGHTAELEHINFNQVYPEEVIYVKTNAELWRHVSRNPFYKSNYPVWAWGRRCNLYSKAWVMLTKPTLELRSALNHVLTDIAKSMIDTSQNVTNSSSIAAINGTLIGSRQPQKTLKEIDGLRGFELSRLNLVCVHVRIGHSKSLPFESNIRNTEDSVGGVWDFLKRYIQKGYHVYIATDSNKVRSTAKDLFGDRIHYVEDPIVHIATIMTSQDARQGMKTALLEQLLLMTSCEVLVVSHSGFSMIAAYVRMKLMGYVENYMFTKGVVSSYSLW